MSRKHAGILVTFLLILGAAFTSGRLHRIEQQREKSQSESETQAAQLRISEHVKVGDRREQVKAQLRGEGLEVQDIWFGGVDAAHLHIPLGRRASGVWYCGPVQYGIAIRFNAAPGSDGSSADGNDTVTQIEPFELADNCL
jgi:hypothetical protein